MKLSDSIMLSDAPKENIGPQQKEGLGREVRILVILLFILLAIQE